MFEQSLYNQEAFAPTPESHEGDLFYNYEFKNWNFSPRLYKILASAVVLDLLFLVVIAQADLTKKGCDTFITSTVCQVIDTAYVANALFGTKREYVDAVYEKTQLKDADIVLIDVSDADPPFEYPGCYFPEATPVQCGVPDTSNPSPGYIAPGLPIPNFPNQDSLLARKAHPPKANPNAVEGNIPSSPLGDANDGQSVASDPKNPGSKKFPASKNGNGQLETSPNSNQSANTNSNPTPMSSEAVAAVQINKKPLTDFADGVVTRWTNKEIDLNQPFTVVLNAVLTADGKIDPKKSTFDVSKEKGDQKMIDVAKAALEAMGDSGYLTYLKSLNVDKVTVTLVQDDTQIAATITSSQKTAERARVISSGLNGYIMVGKAVAKDPSDERTLLDSAKVTSDAKDFVLYFAIPKPIAQEMITRKLKEAQAKKAQQPQPNSVAPEKPNQNTAKY